MDAKINEYITKDVLNNNKTYGTFFVTAVMYYIFNRKCL